VQATVESYDGGEGHVVLDDGTRLAFGATPLAGSQIRLLRPGQRVSIAVRDGVVRRLWLPGIGRSSQAGT
jgi:hypothetical protein